MVRVTFRVSVTVGVRISRCWGYGKFMVWIGARIHSKNKLVETTKILVYMCLTKLLVKITKPIKTF